jgi:UMF1 family MFS transporter
VTDNVIAGYVGIDDDEYRRRIRAWTIYDWANSAFATTILAAVLPVYYSQVAGSTLGSPAQATALWTVTLSVSLVIVAVLSPILGTISDIMRGKKKFLAFFIGLGTIGTGLLVLIGSGDWLLASVFFIVGRIGFAAANVFYDSLLPHVAREDDQDRVSTRGYAIGYLGGGLLLAVNIVMIFTLGSNLGTRLSFLSVAIWWAAFSIPILRRVPEPPAAGRGRTTQSVYRASFARLKETFHQLRRYRQLLRFLIAFLIYNDGIGTIIGVAAIYGAELGFGALELIAAILLVQFVGIPFSLAFGRIPSRSERRRPFFLAFIVWNLVVVPIVGIGGRFTLGEDVAGTPKAEFVTEGRFVGEDEYTVASATLTPASAFEVRLDDSLPSGARGDYAYTADTDAVYEFAYNGQKVELTYSDGPNRSDWAVFVDGSPALDDDDDPMIIEAYNKAERFEVTIEIDARSPGLHLLEVRNTTTADDDSTGTVMTVGEIEVLPAPRESAPATLLGLLLLIQLFGLGFAALFGNRLFGGLADTMTTRRTIVLALMVYVVIAVWGFFLDAVIEFWYLAWMVAVVQGGSQALSRSLYAAMSPTSESGEFFGFFSVMSKFSAIVGPLFFAGAVALFDSSRPAILFIVVFFIAGIALLQRVDVDEGKRVAREADREAAEAHLIEGT